MTIKSEIIETFRYHMIDLNQIQCAIVHTDLAREDDENDAWMDADQPYFLHTEYRLLVRSTDEQIEQFWASLDFEYFPRGSAFGTFWLSDGRWIERRMAYEEWWELRERPAIPPELFANLRDGRADVGGNPNGAVARGAE